MSAEVLQIIKRPLITEKGTGHLEANVYSFEVAPTATKADIKRAIEKAFKVNVTSVNTINSRGRARRMGRYVSSIKKWKKALVRVKDGQKIKIFEGA